MSYPIQKAGSASDVTSKNKIQVEYGNILAQQLAVEAGIQTKVTYVSGGAGSSSTLLSASQGNALFTIAELKSIVANIVSNTATNSTQANQLAAAANRKLGITISLSNNIISAVVAWSPLLINGISSWFDSSDPNATGTAPANNASLTVWKDKVANISATLASGTLTYNSAGGLNFSSAYLNLPNGTLPFGNNPFTYFFVISPSTSSSMYVAGIGTANVSGQCLALQIRSGIDIDWYAPDLTTTLPPVNQITFLTTAYSGSTRTFTYNVNTSVTGSMTMAYPNTPQQIGAFNSGGAFSGKIYDFIAFSSALTSADKQKVEGYLAWKWGLQVATDDYNPVIKLILDTNTANTGTASATLPTTVSGTVTIGVNGGKLSASFPNSQGTYLSIPFSTISTGSFTISYWFNPGGVGYYNPWALSGDPVLWNNWVINPDLNASLAGRQDFYTAFTGGNVSPSFDFTPTSGAWNYVTYSINAATGECRSYLNGVFKATATATGTLRPTDKLLIGRDGANSRAYLGYIRQFMVHNFVLSQAQITSLYTQTQNFLPSTHLYSSMAPSS